MSTEPTDAQIEAFRTAWLEADRKDEIGNRVRAGLRAALAADRPSVTDNARAEAERRWPRLYGPEETLTYPREAVREHTRAGFMAGAEWAAGRAETTTATTEDTARAIHRALAPRWMSVAQALGPDQDAYEAMLADIAKSLADAGLLATARAETTTATDEDAARVLDDVIQHLRKIWSTGHDEAREVIDTAEELLAQALPRLLATARTRPTREQIDRAVGEVLSNASNHPDPVAVLGRSIAPLRNKVTDAVLELLQDSTR